MFFLQTVDYGLVRLDQDFQHFLDTGADSEDLYGQEVSTAGYAGELMRHSSTFVLGSRAMSA